MTEVEIALRRIDILETLVLGIANVLSSASPAVQTAVNLHVFAASESLISLQTDCDEALSKNKIVLAN